MSAPTTAADLLDLKMMPAWVNEPPRANDYADYQGEDERSFPREGRGPQHGRDARPRGPKREGRDSGRRPGPRRPDSQRPERRDEQRPPREEPAPLPQVDVRFLPHPPAFESVIAQIKSGGVTYSVFALARLFLDKPERYDVQLTAADGAALHQLGEHGAVAVDRRLLEATAFNAARDEFYSIEQTQSEPVKGNFTNVARDRISGTLLGPTNHHGYQPQLRNLYEERFSRRMSFQDYQRQIEIVSDPDVVEQWKEQARSVTTYTTKNVEPPVTFSSAAETERDFRQRHLPELLRSAQKLTISGVLSRRLEDRGLGRVIEDAWAAEIRSPSKMMQELSAGLRGAGLNIFRHRRGMLFVSPFRIRPFGHERGGVSASINGILEKLGGTAGMTRKQLAEKMAPAGSEPAEADRTKLMLASDLHWLISEGYVIEFNDGTLDLPRAKPAAAPAVTEAKPEAVPELAIEEQPASEMPEAEAPPSLMAEASAPEETDAAQINGGISIEQSVAPMAQNPEPIAAATPAAEAEAAKENQSPAAEPQGS